MKDFAIPSVGKDVVLIKNNKVIAKGRSRSSMGYVIGIELLCTTSCVKPKSYLKRLSQLSTSILDSLK